jgi:hypothetical protein
MFNEDQSQNISPFTREVSPFHWTAGSTDERFCVRPASEGMIYQWSGGIDPLIIGTVPVKAFFVRGTASTNVETSRDPIRSIYVEIDIRPGSGGTGINISLREESNEGKGSLFRIENYSPMPIWIAQDAKAAGKHDAPIGHGDLVDSMTQTAFGLTHPSIFQKRGQGQATSSLSSRLVVRVGLCPLSSLPGFDSSETIVLDATKDDQSISLFPSVIGFFRPDSLGTIQQAVIAGSLANDGPTRVLTLR